MSRDDVFFVDQLNTTLYNIVQLYAMNLDVISLYNKSQQRKEVLPHECLTVASQMHYVPVLASQQRLETTE